MKATLVLYLHHKCLHATHVCVSSQPHVLLHAKLADTVKALLSCDIIVFVKDATFLPLSLYFPFTNHKIPEQLVKRAVRPSGARRLCADS